MVRMRARTMKEQTPEDLPQELHATAQAAKLVNAATDGATASALESSSASGAETLVIYTYSKSDPEYERNLIFFIQHGMWEHDGCEYLIIVQQACVQSAFACFAYGPVATWPIKWPLTQI